MKNKLISFILLAVMLAPLLLACADANDENIKEPQKEEYEGIVIDDEYAVVRATKASKSVIKSASYLNTQINTLTSLKVDFKTDFYRNPDEISEKEILVGKTNRETNFDRTTLKEGEYYIGIEGSKIIIDAYDDATLYFAVKDFTAKWLSEDLGIQKDGALLINEEICSELNGLKVMPSNTITILSQNIRNKDDGNGNDIKDRAPRFQQMIEKYSPDIIGTQEDNADWKSYFKKYFQNEYTIINDNSLQNSILFKTERFELIEDGKFWLSNTPNVASKVPESTYNRICIWALLKDKQSGKTILMANTHLDHGPDAAREKQGKILVDYLKKRFSDYPIFVTGDYNFEPSSVAYNVVNKELNDIYSEALWNRSNTSHTYPAYQGSPNKKLDYCFFNDKSTAISCYIVNDSFNGCVSDHYGILSEFVLN